MKGIMTAYFQFLNKKEVNCERATLSLEFDFKVLQTHHLNPLAQELFIRYQQYRNYNATYENICKDDELNLENKQEMIIMLGLHKLALESLRVNSRYELYNQALDFLLRSSIDILGDKYNLYSDKSIGILTSKEIVSDSVLTRRQQSE